MCSRGPPRAGRRRGTCTRCPPWTGEGVVGVHGARLHLLDDAVDGGARVVEARGADLGVGVVGGVPAAGAERVQARGAQVHLDGVLVAVEGGHLVVVAHVLGLGDALAAAVDHVRDLLHGDGHAVREAVRDGRVRAPGPHGRDDDVLVVDVGLELVRGDVLLEEHGDPLREVAPLRVLGAGLLGLQAHHRGAGRRRADVEAVPLGRGRAHGRAHGRARVQVAVLAVGGLRGAGGERLDLLEGRLRGDVVGGEAGAARDGRRRGRGGPRHGRRAARRGRGERQQQQR